MNVLVYTIKFAVTLEVVEREHMDELFDHLRGMGEIKIEDRSMVVVTDEDTSWIDGQLPQPKKKGAGK